jgi:hypothetical protein
MTACLSTFQEAVGAAPENWDAAFQVRHGLLGTLHAWGQRRPLVDGLGGIPGVCKAGSPLAWPDPPPALLTAPAWLGSFPPLQGELDLCGHGGLHPLLFGHETCGNGNGGGA